MRADQDGLRAGITMLLLSRDGLQNHPARWHEAKFCQDLISYWTCSAPSFSVPQTSCVLTMERALGFKVVVQTEAGPSTC